MDFDNSSTIFILSVVQLIIINKYIYIYIFINTSQICLQKSNYNAEGRVINGYFKGVKTPTVKEFQTLFSK